MQIQRQQAGRSFDVIQYKRALTGIVQNDGAGALQQAGITVKKSTVVARSHIDGHQGVVVSTVNHYASVRQMLQLGADVVSLSPRQVTILELMALGLSNKEIAAQLHIAPTRVREYVSDLLELFSSDNRTQAVLKARALGFILD